MFVFLSVSIRCLTKGKLKKRKHRKHIFLKQYAFQTRGSSAVDELPQSPKVTQDPNYSIIMKGIESSSQNSLNNYHMTESSTLRVPRFQMQGALIVNPACGDLWRGEHARFRRCLLERDLHHKGPILQWWIALHSIIWRRGKFYSEDFAKCWNVPFQRSSCWWTRWTFSLREARRLQPLLPGRWDLFAFFSSLLSCTFLQLSRPKREFWARRKWTYQPFSFLSSSHQKKNLSAQTRGMFVCGLQPAKILRKDSKEKDEEFVYSYFFVFDFNASAPYSKRQ